MPMIEIYEVVTEYITKVIIDDQPVTVKGRILKLAGDNDAFFVQSNFHVTNEDKSIKKFLDHACTTIEIAQSRMVEYLTDIHAAIKMGSKLIPFKEYID